MFQEHLRPVAFSQGPRATRLTHTKARRTIRSAGFALNNPGGFLLSHAVARAVPSAPRGLTSVFGMGTGVTLSTQPPENCFQVSNFKFEIDRVLPRFEI